MDEMLTRFYDILCEKDPFQEKHLKQLDLDSTTQAEFVSFLEFCMEELKESMDHIAEAYLFLNDMILQETYFFKRNGHYRHSSLEEVAADVYHNEEYMKNYMIGLAVSDFLWPQHLKILDYYEKYLESFPIVEGSYLEIGPGSGQLLLRAVNSGKFSEMTACDISESSAELCNRFLDFMGKEKECRVIVKNFFDFPDEKQFDCIVMGEVLEHVEDPESMLRKIGSLLKNEGRAFVSTVINAPAIDHIYLFRNEEEVKKLVEGSGFEIVDSYSAAIGGVQIEKAMKRKDAVTIAMWLQRR